MSDGVTLNPGAAGDVIAADDISSAKYQRVKLIHGVDGTNDGDVAVTNPLPTAVSANGTQNLNVYRYLDTVGDGSGTKNANGNYAGGATIFRLAPAASTIYRVARMMISIGDTKGMVAEEYGDLGSALGNGVIVRVHNGSSTVLDITDNLPVTTNGEWGRVCFDVDIKSWGNTNELLVARWTFMRAGQYLRLDGDASEELQVVLEDNLTGLLSHHFFAQGYEEDSAT